MIKIPLTKGYVAVISDEDAHLANYSWSAHVTRCGHVYAIRGHRRDDGKYTTRYLHRDVLRLSESDIKADHINGNTLDNTRGNLRAVTNSENARNIAGSRSHNRYTGVLGVHLAKRRGAPAYVAQIRRDGKVHHLGSFKTLEEAANARLEAEKKIWGISPRRRHAHISGAP